MTISDSSDSVVKFSTTKQGVGQNTRCVRLEVSGGGSNGNGDWLLDECSLQSSDVGWGHLGVGGSSNVGSLVGNIGAGGVSGGVWPVVFVVGTVRFVVVEGVTLPATIAAEAGLDARDKLLLRELGHGLGALVVGDVVGRLEARD